MTERDEFRGFLCATDPGKNGGVENGAFFIFEFSVFHLGEDFTADFYETGCGGGAHGLSFCGNINHAGLVGIIEVGQF